jgi:hypothetical protein
MSKSKNRSMRNNKNQGNRTTQNFNIHTTKDVMDSKGEEISVLKLKRIMVRMIEEVKEDMKETSQ